MKLKRQVVMLATNQRAVKQGDLVLDSVHRMFVASANMRPNSLIADYYQSQYLYITSDEDIKENDWFYSPATKEVLRASKEMLSWNSDTTQEHKGWKKVIAATDKSLGLPSPSPEFVQAYIKAYNAGKPITDVMVEYEEYVEEERITGTNASFRIVNKSRLKVDKDNCITITKVKDSWTREEVIAILHKHLDDSSTKHEAFHKILKEQLNEWIEENL